MQTNARRTKADLGPAVTAIIPAYNMEQFIERTLASALSQTYRNLNVLVIDDGSTDRTRQIAEQFAASHANLSVETVANGGVATARNHGLRLAKTPYVAFLDADDLWHPTKIERQVAAIAVHGHDSEWAGAYGLTRFIDPDDRVLANDFASEARGNFLASHLYRNHVASGSNLLVRREAALAVGGFDPGYVQRGQGGVEDYDFQLKLLGRYKLELVREFLVGYRIYPGQMSDDRARMGRGRIAVIDATLARPNGLPKGQVRHVWTHARFFGGLGQARAGRFAAMVAMLAECFARQPVTTLGLLREILAMRRSRALAARSADAPVAAELSPRRFSELDPASGVPAKDDINTRPRLELEAFRARSSAPLSDGAAQSDRTASG